jgi:hypothetical protein
MAQPPAAAVPPALQRQLRALLLPGAAPYSAAALASRLRAVADALEAAPPAAPRDDSTTAAEPAAAAEEAEEEGAPAAKRRVVRPFDLANYPTLYVALELFYAGWAYHGFASQGCVSARLQGQLLHS